MPIYEFECEGCGEVFEELVAAGAAAPCPECGSERTRRLMSTVSPPGRTPRGAGGRSGESRRRGEVGGGGGGGGRTGRGRGGGGGGGGEEAGAPPGPAGPGEELVALYKEV